MPLIEILICNINFIMFNSDKIGKISTLLLLFVYFRKNKNCLSQMSITKQHINPAKLKTLISIPKQPLLFCASCSSRRAACPWASAKSFAVCVFCALSLF